MPCVIVMTVFCLLYSNTSIHYPNESGATDYKWTSNAFYSSGKEGIAQGRTNNDGFVNAYDYVNGMKIDIFVMGSSYMEGMNVAQSENTAARLSAAMTGKSVYNIGTSGYTFLTCCSNFEAAVKYYKPSEYVIIETSRLDFTVDKLNSVLDGTILEIADHSREIIGFLSKNPFLRMTYSQIKGFLEQNNNDENEDAAVNGRSDKAKDFLPQLNEDRKVLLKGIEYGV